MASLRFFIIAVTFLPAFAPNGFSQDKQEQKELWGTWNNKSLHDTLRLEALGSLAWSFIYTNPDSAYTLAQVEIDYARQKKDLHYQGDGLNTQGGVYEIKSEPVKALDKYFERIRLLQGSGIEADIAGTYNNIGNIYINMEEFKKAVTYYEMALNFYEKKGDRSVLAAIYGNLGNAFHGMLERDKALPYYLKGIALYEQVSDSAGIARVSLNTATLYSFKKDFDRSMAYFKRSYDHYSTSGDKVNMGAASIGLGELLVETKRTDEGIKMIMEGLALTRETGARMYEVNGYKALYKAYKSKNDPRKALMYHEMYMTLHDSLSNADLKTKTLQKDLAYKYEKKISNDSIKNAEAKKVQQAELERIHADNKQKQTVQYALFAGLGLILVFAGFLYNRFRITSRQKKIIEEQKALVEEKNHEIMDSINYAQRIQDAYLPPENVFHQIFHEAFLLYKPKDVVSGDFYWFYVMGSNEGKPTDTVFFAVADCTGHGVPGALMSVICCNALNEAVVGKGITDPGKILDEARRIVIKMLKSGNAGQKDGMDIALCKFDRGTNELWFAGANNALVIVKQNRELVELKPDKQPVGMYEKSTDFKTTRIQLEKGDMIYAYSDGYADQFGGPKGKKFKYSSLNASLKTLSPLPWKEQKQKLEKEFEQWRGELEQVDDICIMGIKI